MGSKREKIKKWQDIPLWGNKDRCPVCNSKLQKKHEGMVCRNSCPLDFKCGTGWVYLKPKDNPLRWTLKYDFDIIRHENIKKWLRLKSDIIYIKKCCEICKTDRRLEVHHILPRSSNPELGMDKENLIVLCVGCHGRIHSKDKYRFSRSNNGQ